MTQETGNQNRYLDEVMSQTESVMRELAPRERQRVAGLHLAEAPAGIDYRITGFWRFKTVIVPPHVYAVHTRRGREEPLHIGLGISFGFDPARDSFLLIPAVVQTLIIDARCISREKQGLSVQAYVQWMVDDIATAYRKLDFSDRVDPMRIVNVQLREQAKAVVQDKVATMSLEEVLSDKQPIIEELTRRLRQVTEGQTELGPESGLGLKIVTVQIREAVVRSARLWDNLQIPFRAEQERIARLAELQARTQIESKSLETRTAAESATLAAESDLASRRAAVQREKFDLERTETDRRVRLNEESDRRLVGERVETERIKEDLELVAQLAAAEREKTLAAEKIAILATNARLDEARAEAARLEAEREITLAERRDQAAGIRESRTISLFEQRRRVENQISDEHLRALLIGKLPEIAKLLPAPAEMRTIAIDQGNSSGAVAPLLGFITSIQEILRGGATPAIAGETPR
jgi:hypothetical protein